MDREGKFKIQNNIIYDYLGNEEKIVIPDGIVGIRWLTYEKEFVGRVKEIIIPESVSDIDFGVFKMPNLYKITIPKNVFECIDKRYIKFVFDFDDLGQKLLEGKAEYSECLENAIIAYVKEKKYRYRYIDEALKKDSDTVVKNMLVYVKKLKLDEIDMWIKKAIESRADRCKIAFEEFKESLYSADDQKKNAIEKELKASGKKELSPSEWRQVYKISKYSKGVKLKEYKGQESVIDIPEKIGKDSVIYLEETFHGCTFVKEVTISRSVTSIGVKTFMGCEGIETISIPPTVEVIRTKAFSNCINLKNIVFEGEDTKIGAMSINGLDMAIFENCSSLQEIKIPNIQERIVQDAFKNCTSLSSVILPKALKVIQRNAFKNCVSLENIVLPKGVERIDDNAFMDCKSLKSINIPESVTSIENNAFKGCENIVLTVVQGSYGEQYAIKRKLQYIVG